MVKNIKAGSVSGVYISTLWVVDQCVFSVGAELDLTLG